METRGSVRELGLLLASWLWSIVFIDAYTVIMLAMEDCACSEIDLVYLSVLLRGACDQEQPVIGSRFPCQPPWTTSPAKVQIASSLGLCHEALIREVPCNGETYTKTPSCAAHQARSVSIQTKRFWPPSLSSLMHPMTLPVRFPVAACTKRLGVTFRHSLIRLLGRIVGESRKAKLTSRPRPCDCCDG